ncbi:RNA polymerase sigma factor [Fictibacillus aquaticus]|uniref:RNA polymerase subunit sigma n=1 Tax=Fictibacillus aquaticus TaxID=2021314 RepID=A0A235F7P1_9BACL|nr:sigma-70 family RNA polymerase sigma factor [Fictibacillus aquaticus]OYD57371.1 RNA polymerase subunit sigma [Fictibacillus aquaticus]
MTDAELIAEAKNGSQASQEILVRRHYKLVFSFLYRMTGEKELAMDLTQETFIKSLNQLSKYKPMSDFKSWLLTVASNHAKDYLKSRNHKDSQNTYELLEKDMKQGKSVASIFEKNEKRKEVKEALLSLPDFQREAILLKYYNDMKIAEIASITNASVPTVKSRLKQGLGKLKLYLNRGERDEERTV